MFSFFSIILNLNYTILSLKECRIIILFILCNFLDHQKLKTSWNSFFHILLCKPFEIEFY